MAHRRTRLAVVFAGVAIALAVLYVLTQSGGYEIRAQFYNAGQLVEGGEVRVAGRVVGSIEEVALGDDQLADVTLKITDGDITPLHHGARAQIRALGAAGIANRYINLEPGSQSAAELAEGATLPPSQTDGIVELDSLLAVFKPKVRADFETLVTESAGAFAGSSDRHWNSMLAKLDPALAQVDGVLADVTSDQAQLSRLIHMGSETATAIASRRQDLVTAVGTSAEWMSAIADQREHLAGALDNAPPALTSATRTLAKADGAIAELQPALPSVERAAKPLAGVLEGTTATLPRATPIVRDLTGQLPAVNKSLRRLDTLERPLRGAFRQAGPAFRGMTPILDGFRVYSVDIAIGLVNGLAALVGGNYNLQGHYLHANFAQSPQTIGTTPLVDLLSAKELIPGLIGARTDLTRTCPGGLTPPAPDGSSPVHDRPDLCDPEDSMPAYVNDPPGK